MSMMNTVDLTRREFLQVSGIAFAASALTTSGVDRLFQPTTQIIGRALRATALYDAPSGHKLRPVLPDTILKLRSVDDGWYSTPDGYLPRRDLQPMQIKPASRPAALPALIEVSAPAAAIYAYADASTAAITRIGHGGVVHAVDWLPEAIGDHGWYLVADNDGTPLGWTQAMRWRTSDSIEPIDAIDRITIDRQHHLLTAFSDAREVAYFAVSVASAQAAGRYDVIDRMPSVCCTHEASRFYGAPWALMLSNHLQIAGAYWHNDFGTYTRSSAQIELPPFAAQWLYEHLSAQAAVEIV